MGHDIILYGSGYSRSARCRWTLLELGLPFEYVDDPSLVGSQRLRAMHPLAKLPAAVIDGEPLFESAAICTYLCDLAPKRSLIGGPGTRERALHDQWTSFVLTELEAYLWSNAKHMGFYPAEKRVPAVVAPNNEEIRKAVAVLNEALAADSYLVADRFGVTDIIVGWAVNWARRLGHLDEFDHVLRYVGRLLEREHCTLNPD